MDEWQARVGALIRKYRGVMTQGTLAELVSEEAGRKITQGQVSEHERGRRWEGNYDLVGAYGAALGIPLDELHEAVGLARTEPHPRPKTFAEIVAQDKTLSKAAKDHLLNQYELLQMATQHERSGQPVLHQDKRKRA